MITESSDAVTRLTLYFSIKRVIGNNEIASSIENSNGTTTLCNVYNKAIITTRLMSEAARPTLL